MIEIASWQDLRGNGQVFGQRLRADGSVAPGWVVQGRPLSTSFNHKFTPRAVADGQGGFYGTWEQYNLITGREEIYAHHVRSDGTLAPGWPGEGLAIATGSSVSYRNAYSVNPDGAGGAFLAFDAAGGGKILVHAHRIANDGPVATRLSLVDATVNGDEVVVRWQASEAASLSAIVERQSEGSDWTALGAPELEGPDRLVHREGGLSPGRYGFRLRYAEGTIELHTEATWIEVTASAQLDLAGFRPNPAVGAARLAFTLPDDRPARLEVFDVKGRNVRTQEVGTMGVGAHSISFAGEASLAAGMYWIRLTHPERTLTTKGLVVR